MRFFMLVKLFFQRNFVFRFNFVMSWTTTVIRFLFTVLFWLSAMGKNSETFAYSNNEMILYFLVVMLIGLFIQTDTTDKVCNSIYSGNLSVDLLKPISYHILSFANNIAMKLIIFLVIIISVTILSFFSLYSPLFVVSILISFVINFEMSYLIGLFAFWTNIVWGISMVNSVLTDVFGGRLFPISIAGPIMKKICSCLPYQYIYYIPTQILERKQGADAIIVQLLYALILYLVNRLVFRQGLKRFEAVGV